MAEGFDPARSVENITRIIVTYRELIDRGDFEGSAGFLTASGSGVQRSDGGRDPRRSPQRAGG
jgi:hypothetical protein